MIQWPLNDIYSTLDDILYHYIGVVTTFLMAIDQHFIVNKPPSYGILQHLMTSTNVIHYPVPHIKCEMLAIIYHLVKFIVNTSHFAYINATLLM